MPSMEVCGNHRMLMKNHFLRGAVEMVLGQRIVAPREKVTFARAPHGSRGPTPTVGSCCVCRDQKRKQRKTRKSCVVCGQPVGNEHSVSKRCAFLLKMNKLFLLYSLLRVVNKLIDLRVLIK